MAKKPVKKTYSNKSTVSKKKPHKSKKSGPCGGNSARNSRGPAKLKP